MLKLIGRRGDFLDVLLSGLIWAFVVHLQSSGSAIADDLPIDQIKLPAGFQMEVFSRQAPTAARA